MAEGKWIPGLTADTPPAEAARRVLAERLHVVRHFLPLAVATPEKDVEFVHQLRVGTRRAGAALKIFGDCMTAKKARELRKSVRRIRRAAGEARDWDVFLDVLAAWAPKRPAAEQHGLDLLRGYAFTHRQEAQAGLADVADTAPENPEDDDIQSDSDPKRLADLALATLDPVLNDFDTLMAKDLADYSHLHQIRIAGKRLRYAMEVFADCFAPKFRDELYPAIEEMQEILGDANDSHVAQQRLVDLRDRLRASRPKE